jgi:uncharacterized coiled-coil protein SlyX
LIDQTNNLKNKLTDTIKTSKKAVSETTKINLNVRLLVETSDGLTKEAKVTEKVSSELIHISKKLKEVSNKLNQEIYKFKI